MSSALLLSGAVYAQQPDAKLDGMTASNAVTAPAIPQMPPPPMAGAVPTRHKLGPLEISINWRTRTEGWNYFQGPAGNSDYGFWNSTLRIGIGQTGERVDWFLEGEQPSILGLPNDAVVPAPQGQLGLGGTYYARKQQSHQRSQWLRQTSVREPEPSRSDRAQDRALRIFRRR